MMSAFSALLGSIGKFMSRRLPLLNPLKAFEAAGRRMSLSAAAHELGVTPAAVSRQVKLLEDSFGVPLFTRHHRAIRLTRSGEKLLKEISPAFDIIENAAAALWTKGDRNVLKVQAYTTFAMRWMIPRLPKFRALWPNIDIQITTSLKPVSFENSSLDASVQVGDGHWPGVKSTLVLPIRLVPVCSPALAAKYDLKTPQDLGKVVLLHSLARRTDWNIWLDSVGCAAVKGASEMRIESTNMALQAAIEGIGVAIAQQDFVESDIANGVLIKPFDTHVELPEAYYFIHPEGADTERRVRVFRDWLLTCIESDRDLSV